MILSYKKKFIKLALEVGALKFGEFKPKSGRIRPYFFNSGMFTSGRAAVILGQCYAAALIESKINYGMLFGPAYKGIPLVALTSAAMSQDHNIDLAYCFNRKELKAHGEGGVIVGKSPNQKILIIDDVITAGTAIREAIKIVEASGGNTTGVLLALDRQEKGQGKLSAVQEVEKEFNIPVLSIIQLSDLIIHLKDSTEDPKLLNSLLAYQDEYGV